MNLTRTETYLAAFHDANPGVTSQAFGALRGVCGERSFGSTCESVILMLPGAGAQPLTVLDPACADGHLLALLNTSRRAGRLALIGVDLSAGEPGAARARLGDRAALYRCKAQQLPLASGSVDVVFSHLALMLMLMLMLMDDADAALLPLCSPNGDIRFEERYRQFSARAAL